MPRSLSPLFVGNELVDRHGGAQLLLILRWGELVTGFTQAPTVAALDKTSQAAAIVTTTLYTPTSGGMFVVNTALARVVSDGVSSSAQITIGWTQNGVAQTLALAAITEAGVAVQGVSTPIWADANAPITVAVAYASNTGGKMKFDCHATAQQMA